MWLIAREGFVSVVEHRDDSSLVMVRARARQDLDRLIDMFDLDVEVQSTPRADYPFRVVLPRVKMADIARDLILGIDYDNFKSAVHHVDPVRAHGAYMRVWSVLHELTHGPERVPSYRGRLIDDFDLDDDEMEWDDHDA